MKRQVLSLVALLVLATVLVLVLSDGSRFAAAASAVRPGFNTSTLAANDDGSTALVNMGFTVDFYGTNYSSLYVNNNGNVTFDFPLGTYTPFDLTSTGRVIIAPFFGDVDTRVGNVVTYGTGTVNGRPTFGVNWPLVGCFSTTTHVLNDFQVLLIDRSDIAAGDFDIEFNYDQIQWETGQASLGDANCLGGFSARVGYSDGSGNPGTFFELPGSAVNGAFLDTNLATGLIHNSLNSATLGRYVFSVRGGVVGPPPVVPCPSAKGCDNFDSRWAVELKLTNPPIGTLTCSGVGPTQVALGNVGDKQPNGLDELPTEITFMQLTGLCQPGNVAFTINESPTLASSGQVEEQANPNPGTLDFPADSFFDVFFEVDSPIGTLHNTDPLTMECKVSELPPIDCLYIPSVPSVDIFDDSGKLVGRINHGTHTPQAVDTDLDGCSNTQEQQVAKNQNYLNFWDFFDTPPRDQAVTVADIFAVASRFGATGDPTGSPFGPVPPAPGYHTGFDRADVTVPGKLAGPPNGAITIADIFKVASQFGKDCA